MWQTKLCLATSPSFEVSDVEQLELFRRHGFDGFFTDYENDENIAICRRKADELGLLFQSVHAPFSKTALIWEGSDEEAQKGLQPLLSCLRVCAENRVPLMVAHAYIGFVNHTPTQQGLERFGQVVREAERLGVRIAFENTEGEEYLAALMQAFAGEKHVGFCWDTGHEECYNRGKSMMSLYGDRILGTHINDNLGISDFSGENIFWTDDLHLLPFDGICDWTRIAQELVQHRFTECLTFELTMKSKPNRFENDKYRQMGLDAYLTETFQRACRVAAMVRRAKEN